MSSLKIWQISHFAVLSYELLLNTICNAFTLELHSVNKQKNNERCSQLMFLQCSQHKQFYSYTLEFSIILSIPCMWDSSLAMSLNSHSFHFIEYLPNAADSVEEYCCKILCNFQEWRQLSLLHHTSLCNFKGSKLERVNALHQREERLQFTDSRKLFCGTVSCLE